MTSRHCSDAARGRRWLLAALTILSLTASAGAHTVPVEPTVAVTVRPEGDRVHVRVVVPIPGLADADLPRTETRRLARPAADEILRLVAREIASALSFAEGQNALEPPAAEVAIASDESQVEFALTYTTRPARGPLSARLHTFPAVPRPLSMVATFEAAGERPRTFVVANAPERVVFEPGISTVARDFAAQGGRTLVENRDALLMAVILVVAIGARRDLRRAVLAMAAGHAVAFIVRAGALAPPTGEPSTVAASVAASVVVAAAAVLIGGGGATAFTALALAFGLSNGAALGEALRSQSSFAGAHPAVAVGTAVAVTAIGQIWIVAVLAIAIGLVRARGLSDRLLRYAAGAWTAHTALHLIADRTIVPEGTESSLLTRLEAILLLSWVAALVAVAAFRAVRGQTIAPHQS
jgi:hypothetical protein